MPAFSRGFDAFMRQNSFRLPSSLRAALFGTRESFFTPTTLRQNRSFTSSVLRRYQYYKSTVVTPKASGFVNNDPVLRQVVQTRQPILLYQAPKNKWYYLKVYGTGALWIGVGAYSIKFNDDIKDKGLSFFVRPTYIVVGVSFVIIGCYICTAPSNRMRALEILPSLQGGPMQLRMTVKPVPWLKERVIYSNLGAVTISEKTEPMVQELLEAERFRKQRLWDDLGHMNIAARVWEGSARWVHQKWTNFFLKFKFAVLRFGIAKVKVEGDEWKIDCSGYLLENGRAVDRIIPEE
ncbi:unnamed protein product [Alternaria alternata]|uniref:Uncharacterized protein n=1 Tax=Alternaria tenuissima TaxID=119927 RepID=A0A4Q4PMT0_9PLEO|nr:hypothetical protein B0T12DRAFT_174252 [Alternaria alternata]RYN24306.1 hypothetical protein AA0115_g8127 [Alternaria tenuissima]OWY41489.1 hypothetical protein AALT_g1242 [Alternaria alternata]RYN88640.1 hypothetical protein AA0120_g6910 [Alternaria tenuissima]RYO04703.1 hypothetical protein AA0119_g3741 [Alternaria tenuissima]